MSDHDDMRGLFHRSENSEKKGRSMFEISNTDRPVAIARFAAGLDLINHVHHDHDRFLPCGEQSAKGLLGFGEIGLGLGAGIAQGRKLGLDGVGFGGLILKGVAKIAHLLLNVGWRLILAGALGSVGAIWRATARSAWATHRSAGAAWPAEHSSAGVTLKLAHLINRRFEHFPFVVAGAEHLFHPI
jgi:hypothetical protein